MSGVVQTSKFTFGQKISLLLSRVQEIDAQVYSKNPSLQWPQFSRNSQDFASNPAKIRSNLLTQTNKAIDDIFHTEHSLKNDYRTILAGCPLLQALFSPH